MAAGVLLAAGESRRMGRQKALLPHPDGSGRTLVQAAAETLLAAGLRPLVVVLGHSGREIAPELRGFGQAVRAVANPAYRNGMLSSLQAGVRAVAGERETRWALVAPLDQPFLSPGLVGRLLSRAGKPGAPAAAVVPATPEMERRGTWGLPVLLSRRLFPEVVALRRAGDDEDRGAGKMLARRRQELAFVRADELELLDLDDRNSYEQARRAISNVGDG